MKGIAVVGFLAAVVFSAASSPGQALLLDGAALRAEIVRRQAGYTGRLDAALKRKQLGLERALLALDSPSSTLQGDLRIARWTAQALDRPFGTDGPLFGMVEEYADRASALTAGARDGLEACLAAETDAEAAADALLHLARADRRLAAAETAATRARRIRLLEAAMREVDAGLLALEEGAGAPRAGGPGCWAGPKAGGAARSRRGGGAGLPPGCRGGRGGRGGGAGRGPTTPMP